MGRRGERRKRGSVGSREERRERERVGGRGEGGGENRGIEGESEGRGVRIERKTQEMKHEIVREITKK